MILGGVVIKGSWEGGVFLRVDEEDGTDGCEGTGEEWHGWA